MAWADRTDHSLIPDTDMRDADSTGELQAMGPLPDDLRSSADGTAGTYVWSEHQFETYFASDGTLTSLTRRPTKADLVGSRQWSPLYSSDSPGKPVCTLYTTPVNHINVTLPPPSTDPPPSWGQTDIVYDVCRNVDGGAFSSLTTKVYGTASFMDSAVSSGHTYAYQIRLKNTTTGDVGNWSTASDGVYVP